MLEAGGRQLRLDSRLFPEVVTELDLFSGDAVYPGVSSVCFILDTLGRGLMAMCATLVCFRTVLTKSTADGKVARKYGH